MKKEERLQKLKEEAEDEAKFRAQHNNQQQQFQQTRERNKMKEVSLLLARSVLAILVSPSNLFVDFT